jgi:CheY-like chemotaxis protein
MRVLVAEDNPANQHLISVLLSSLGICPVIVGDGAAALGAYRQAQFDLVLMDISMPIMDGLTAIRFIRLLESHERRDRTPIIVISSQCDEGDIRASEAAGADKHLPKPMVLPLVLGAVEDALRTKTERLGDGTEVARHNLRKEA